MRNVEAFRRYATKAAVLADCHTMVGKQEVRAEKQDAIAVEGSLRGGILGSQLHVQELSLSACTEGWVHIRSRSGRSQAVGPGHADGPNEIANKISPKVSR